MKNPVFAAEVTEIINAKNNKLVKDKILAKNLFIIVKESVGAAIPKDVAEASIYHWKKTTSDDITKKRMMEDYRSVVSSIYPRKDYI